MSEFICADWYDTLARSLASAEREVYFVSPFVGPVATALIEEVIRPNVKCRLITRLALSDLSVGASSLETLQSLLDINVGIKAICGLHAKLVVVDGNIAIVSSANLTHGGYGSNLEAGVLLTGIEAKAAVDWVRQLWLTLRSCVDHELLNKAKATIDEFNESHLLLSLAGAKALGDWGEKLVDDHINDKRICIRLRRNADKTRILGMLDRFVAAGDARDYQLLIQNIQEQNEADRLAICVRAYLWLMGWCDTGGRYKRHSQEHAQPIANEMFGYIPQDMEISGEQVTAKHYRYRDTIPEQIVEQIVAAHDRAVG